MALLALHDRRGLYGRRPDSAGSLPGVVVGCTRALGCLRGLLLSVLGAASHCRTRDVWRLLAFLQNIRLTLKSAPAVSSSAVRA